METNKMKIENKPLEILLVEDCNEHIERAMKIVQRLPEAGILARIDYASNLKEALRYISERRYKGIISDVFYHSNMENDLIIRQELATLLLQANENGGDRTRKCISGIDEWKAGHSEAPMGVYLSEHAPIETPLVFCSSMHHHSNKLEPVSLYVNLNEKRLGGTGIPDTRIWLVDSKADKKNWGSAFAYLNYMINKEDNQAEKIFPLTIAWDKAE